MRNVAGAEPTVIEPMTPWAWIAASGRKQTKPPPRTARLTPFQLNLTTGSPDPSSNAAGDGVRHRAGTTHDASGSRRVQLIGDGQCRCRQLRDAGDHVDGTGRQHLDARA